MVVVPTVVLAVTMPVEGSIDAIDGAELLHAPPAVASPSVVVPLVQVLRDPVIAAGEGFTVTAAVAVEAQPLYAPLTVYVVVVVVLVTGFEMVELVSPVVGDHV